MGAFDSNFTFYTVPAAFVLLFLPKLYSLTVGGKYLDPAHPRAFQPAIQGASDINERLKARILRAESAFANGLETIGLYAAAVVAVNIGGSNGSNGGVRVNPRAANALSLAYLLTRVVYTVIYVVLQDPTRDGGDGGRDGEEGGGGGEAEDDDDADTVTPESVAAAAALALAGKVGKVGADSPADGRGSESEVKAEEGRMLAEETGGGGKRRRLRPRRRRGGGGGGGRGRARSALPRSGAWALARSATWFAGIGVIFAMFTLAGAATYDA